MSEATENRLVARTVVLRAQVALLRKFVRASRREHYHCEDSWYCCGKCTHPDHSNDARDYLHTHVGEAPRVAGVCSCGADDWNQRVDDVLARTEPS